MDRKKRTDPVFTQAKAIKKKKKKKSRAEIYFHTNVNQYTKYKKVVILQERREKLKQ